MRVFAIQSLCLAFVFVLSSLVFSTDGFAQVKIVTVTAQKRTQDITEVPISLVSLTGEELEDANIDSVVELANHMPNLRIDSGVTQPSTSSIGMRGLNTSGGNGGVDPSVGIYLDDVYLPRPQAALRGLKDIQNVEVLRGPQGTLYGRNTPVGAIKINSRRPSHDFEAIGTAGFGLGGNMGMGGRNFSGIVNGGISDDVAARALLYYERNGGYLDNLGGGAENSSRSFGGRLGLLFEPNDDLDVLLSFDFDKSVIHCCAYEWILVGLPARELQNQINIRRGNFSNDGQADAKDGVVDEDADLRNDTKSYGFSMNANYEIGNHTLTNILAYRRWHNIGQGQGDGQPADILRGGQDLSDRSLSEEFRVASPDGGIDFLEGTKLEYIAGVYYYRFNTVNETDLGFGTDAQYVPFFTNTSGAGAIGNTAVGIATRDIYDAQGWAVALFNETILHLTDRFSLIGGIRWSHDEKDATKTQPIRPANAKLLTQLSATPGAFSTSESSITWKAGAQYWLVPEDVQVYFTTATGFKAPGINGAPDRAGGVPGVFASEKSINYEVGTKANFFDRRLTVHLSLYRMMIENLQVTIRNLTGLGTFATNAGKLRSQGAEFSMRANPIDWLTLNAEVAYLDNNYIEFVRGPCFTGKTAAANGYCDLTGRPNEKAPKWGADLTARVDFPVMNTPMGVFASLNWLYTGGVFLDSDLDPRAYQRAIDVWKITMGLKSSDADPYDWQVALWIDNIFNERYFIDAADGLGGALLNTNGTPNSFLGNISMGRTMGITGKVSF